MRLELESILPPPAAREIIEPQSAPANNFAVEAKELLAEGIKAAQSGDRASARVSLLRSSELDPKNENTWLWLASISEYPEELLVFLTNVLELNPENQRAIEWTAATKSLLSKTFVQRGTDAVEENKADYAMQCFNQALEYDQTNSVAWLWMASLCDSNEGKITYFERVLSIDPSNHTAIDGLRSARQKISQRQLAEARAAAVAGRSAEANEFLDAIIAENPNSEDAWILRAHLAEGFDRKILAFQKVLQLNPDNATAKSGLDSLLSIIETVAPNPTPVDVTETEATSLGDVAAETDGFAQEETWPEQFEPEVEFTSYAAPENEAEAEPVAEEMTETPVEMSETIEVPDSEEPAMSFEGDFHSSADGEYASHSSAFFETAVEWTPQPDENEAVAEFEVRLNLPESVCEVEAPPSMSDSPEEMVVELEVHDNMQYPAADEAPAEQECFDSADEPMAADGHFVSEHFEQPTEAYEPAAGMAENFASESAENSDDYFDSVREIPAEVTSREVSEHVEIMPVSSSVVSVADQGNTFSHVTFCSFCNGENDVQAIVCQTCNAVLALSDLGMLIANTNADKLILRDSVERMEAEKLKRELSEAELTMLGIGHLNLHNHQYGFNYLLQASEQNPNNVVLGSQVTALRIRLDEMKRRDEVHETKTTGKTVLIVDDSPTVRKLIAGKLEKCGHRVFCAGDGVEAMERLDDLVPDLVLLDINMPRMDGYQVCKLIRSNTATQDVPVVMISGKDGFFDKVRGRMAGTTGYITKPFGPETLMKTVETYLSAEATAEQVN